MSLVRRIRARWRVASGHERLQMMVIGAAILVVIWTALPFLLMFWASLMTQSELVSGVARIIEEPTLEHYARIMGHADEEAIFGGQTKRIGLGFLNSMIVSLPAAFVAIFQGAFSPEGVAGGAIGNVIDRLRIGAVVDFLDFHAASWHWPAFNLADSAITCGIIILLIEAWRDWSRQRQEASGQ